MSKILITGGLGYIGYSLVQQLSIDKPEHEIIIFDNMLRGRISILFEQSLAAVNVNFIEGDLLDNRKLQRAMKGVDCIIHLAAKTVTPFGVGDFHMFDYVNNWGTANLAKAAEENNVKEIIYLSSTSIYGHSDELMNIESNINPSTDYARSKYLGEKQLSTLKGKLKTIIIRSGNVYGYNPSLRLDTVINNFIFKARFGQTLLINGDGQESRGFISVERLASQISALILNNGFEEPIYQLTDHNIKVADLVKEIQKLKPTSEFRHVNPERKMTNQMFEASTLPTFEKLTYKDLQLDLKEFYDKFKIS